MRLVQTRGVPAEPDRRYSFRGTCRFTHDGRTERIEVLAAGNWDEASREAIEILEPVVGFGSVRRVFRCREDPWLFSVAEGEEAGVASAGGTGAPADAPVSCELLQHANGTGIRAFGTDGSNAGPPGPVTGRPASLARRGEGPAPVAPSTPPASSSEAEVAEPRSPPKGSSSTAARAALLERVAMAPASASGWPGGAVGQLSRISELLAGGRSDEAIAVWRRLLRSRPGRGEGARSDADALANRALRAAYLEPDSELRDQADRLRYYREQEEMARARISELRREETGDRSRTGELGLMEARVAEASREAREGMAALRAAVGRRPELGDRLEEAWAALRGVAGD